jgi:hypothetical protein
MRNKLTFKDFLLAIASLAQIGIQGELMVSHSLPLCRESNDVKIQLCTLSSSKFHRGIFGDYSG